MSQLLKFVDCGDSHGDEENLKVTAKLFAFMDDFKPDIVVHGGDAYDFRYMRAKASPKDRAGNADLDWQMGSEFLLRYFSYGKKRIFLRGNHDERVWNIYRETLDETTRQHAKEGIEKIESLMRKRKTAMLPYDSRTGVLDLDEGLRAIHGYACGVGSARKFAASYGTCIYHHTHTLDVGVFEKWPEAATAYGTGGLLNIDQGYSSTQMNRLRHENGWCYGWIKNNKPTIFQARVRPDGDLILPSEIKIY